MTTLIVHFQSAPDTLMVSPVAAPTIEITEAVEGGDVLVADDDMFEIGGGAFGYVFAAVEGVDYSFVADGDPLVTQQTVSGGRYVAEGFSGDDPAVLTKLTLLLQRWSLDLGGPDVVVDKLNRTVTIGDVVITVTELGNIDTYVRTS